MTPRRIQEILDAYFPDPKVPLHHTNHFTLLIAVLLSANTTDAQVNRVTPELFARASTPEKMVQLAPEEIEAIIRPCGLAPKKSRNIHALSKLLIERFGGTVPKTFEELESLPGVGHKTASVVLCQAFDIAAFPVDTHIFRCARRWKLSKGKTVEQVERDLKEIFPKEAWKKLHLQIIYFARAYCPARSHSVEKCPICSEGGHFSSEDV